MNQTWNPEQYDQHVRFVSDLGMPVIELLDPQPGERILDLGCGDGALTEKLTEMGCRVVGVDASPEQIEAAKRRGLDVHVMDGQALEFESEFDAVFSNAALHWMKRPDDVVAGVNRALQPGGRFVGEFGGYGNIHSILQQLSLALKQFDLDFESLNPWYFPTIEDYQKRLKNSGFEVRSIKLIPRPTPLPGDIMDWFEVFLPAFISSMNQQERLQFYETLKQPLKPVLYKNDQWEVDYVRLRFFASL